MSIIKLLIVNGKRVLTIGQGRKTARRTTARSSVSQATATPIKSTTRKILFLGQTYNIKLTDGGAIGKRNTIRISDSTLNVTLNPMTRENFELYLDGWYRRKARAVINQSIDMWIPQFEQNGYTIAKPQIKLFKMRRAWGRCYYTKGLITINLHLVKAPRECIDYIVLHELCHFVVHNHSATFHNLVAEIMPQWRTIDAQLKAFAVQMRIISNK